MRNNVDIGARMIRKVFQARIDAKIAALENEKGKLEERVAELEEKIDKLSDIRDDPSFDFLLDVFTEPVAKDGKKTFVVGWPKGNQFQRILQFFGGNKNAWTPTGVVASGTGLPTHTVRQLT